MQLQDSAGSVTVDPAQPPEPILVVFTDRRSGRARRAEAFLAQVLQRRGNHGTFRLHRVDVGDRPELFERFAIEATPTLLVIEDKRVRARLVAPRGCRDIESLLTPWLK
jgi:thioredoxin-like negative regulator of GroEL